MSVTGARPCARGIGLVMWIPAARPDTGGARPRDGRLAGVQEPSAVTGEAMSEPAPHGVRPSAILKGIGLCGVVSVLALLPPGVHFVTGPLGPIIGGFVAGAVLRLQLNEAMVLAAVLALAIGLPAPFVLTDLGILPHLATAALVFFAVFAAVYIGVFSLAGAYLGAQSGRRRAP